jgi:hypothetical protein
MKTRSIKELLILVIENKELFRTGLCMLFTELFVRKIITTDEDYLLWIYIRRHKPFRCRIFLSVFYWPKGKWEPRERWLKKQIKKLK